MINALELGIPKELKKPLKKNSGKYPYPYNSQRKGIYTPDSKNKYGIDKTMKDKPVSKILPKKPSNVPHFAIYRLPDESSGLPEGYKDHPTASSAADMSNQPLDTPRMLHDDNYYRMHMDPEVFTYNGSLVPHTAYGF